MTQRTLIVQKWEESERGWGTRPDGYSLHCSLSDRATFIRKYWDGMPDEVPDEYSRPCGAPYAWNADEETYKKVQESTNGIWCRGTPPGSQGTDGWRTIALGLPIS
jgi:hypothetical protein